LSSGLRPGAWEVEHSPRGAKTLVLRVLRKTAERTYPFEFKEVPTRQAEGEGQSLTP